MSQNAQGDHPGYQQEHHGYTLAVAAATATEKRVIFRAKRACRVKSVSIAPSAAVTGQATNTKHLNVHKNVTEVANYDLVGGSNLVAFEDKVLYAPATPLAMAAGDYIAIQHEQVGTGLAVPDCHTTVVIDFEP